MKFFRIERGKMNICILMLKLIEMSACLANLILFIKKNTEI